MLLLFNLTNASRYIIYFGALTPNNIVSNNSIEFYVYLYEY